MLSRVITVNRRRFCPETFSMCVKMVTTFQGVARRPSGEHQSPPVSSLHFCSRRPLSQALLPTLSYVSTFPLNVYSSSGRSQGNECHLYLRMSPPG